MSQGLQQVAVISISWAIQRPYSCRPERRQL